MITYTWSIVTCERDVATGGITVAHWRCNATDGELSASAYGTCGFTPVAKSPEFKPYIEITEAEVLTWVYKTVEKTTTEASLSDEVNSRANPVTISGTPW